MENTKQLSAWSLCLPACRISESVQQLMELALNTLCEAVGSSTQWYVTAPKTLLSSVLTWVTCACVLFCFAKQTEQVSIDSKFKFFKVLAFLIKVSHFSTY